MWRPSLVLRKRSPNLLASALACTFLTCASAPALANDLNAAQKAVRMQQYERAVTLFQQAAEADNPEAQYQLANMYLQGRGTAKDVSKAKQWFELAAKQAHPGAQFGLAQILLDDDPKRARSLLAASAEQGYRSAKIQLERLDPEATANQEAPFEAQWFGAARKDDIPLLEALLAEHKALDITDDAGRTGLFYAIEAGSKKAVQWFIEKGSDVNHRDKFDTTPAQAAVERRHMDLLRTLLKAGANKNQVLSNGDNLLHYALRRQHYEQAKFLIGQGVNINLHNKSGWTPLDLAEYQDAEAIAALLVKRGATSGSGWRSDRAAQDLSAVVNQLDQGALPPLAGAIVNNNQALVERLLAVNPDLVNTPLEDGTTPLILAVKHSKPEMVSTLLKHDAQVNQVAYRGVNAVQVAAQRGDQKVLQILLDAGGFPVNLDEQGRDAMISAIELGHTDIAHALLKHILGDSGNKSRATTQVDGSYAPIDRYILLATRHHADEVLEMLLPHATAIAAEDKQGRNALWFAAREGNSKLIPKLLKAGIAPDQADHQGRTPFLMAVHNGCLECAKQLLPVSNINQQSNTGNTALMMAASNGDESLVSWLVQNKADIEIRNQRGDTALMLAVIGNATGVVKRLLEANASVTRKNKLGFSSIDLAQQVSPQMLELVKSKSVLGIF